MLYYRGVLKCVTFETLTLDNSYRDICMESTGKYRD